MKALTVRFGDTPGNHEAIIQMPTDWTAVNL